MHSKNYLHRMINLLHILPIINENNEIKEVKISGFRYAQSEYHEDNSDIFNLMDENNLLFIDPNAKEEGFSEESDIWSIGLVIYFMTFGSLPSQDLHILRKIRDEGNVHILSDVEANIKSFIRFCFKKRKRGELADKILKDQLLIEEHLIF